jgi:hypothetical protein
VVQHHELLENVFPKPATDAVLGKTNVTDGDQSAQLVLYETKNVRTILVSKNVGFPRAMYAI